MAAMLRIRPASTAKTILGVISFLLILLFLRTPTAPWYAPGPDPEDNTRPRTRLPKYLQDFLKWDWPKDDKSHYPPYGDYTERDYDPNRWEAFKQNNDLYTKGTLGGLKQTGPRPAPFNPYPHYFSQDYKSQWHGSYTSCKGPGGQIMDASSPATGVLAYQGIPEGFPQPDVGSAEAIGLDNNVCFDRYSRMGAYGLGEKNPEWSTQMSQADWGTLQNDCLLLNQARYADASLPRLRPGTEEPSEEDLAKYGSSSSSASSSGELQYKSRTAVLIRTWDNYQYYHNDVQAIRSLVTELSLHSGGEYQVFLFVNVKDMEIDIFNDEAEYNKILENSVPLEFRNMTILWSERVCQQWYPSVGEWAVYWQQFMPLQWFSRTHPEFEYIWNWEMDARYLGQTYHFLESVTNFAKKQPRKFLWERNARYYIPKAHGNSYAKFATESNDLIQEAKDIDGLKTIWGPETWHGDQIQHVVGPTPPHNEGDDEFTWGVDEEADLITLLPIWDPIETFWAYRDKLFNYPLDDSSTEWQPYAHVPRRTFINTVARFSRYLLDAMHAENKVSLSMASEMWPASIALQHGLKAVYAPHPVWASHEWPGWYADMAFNADGWGAGSMPGHSIDDGRGRRYSRQREIANLAQNGTGPTKEGRRARWGQERDSPYNPDREHYFAGWSWYFWSDFPHVLYFRWLGWSAGFNVVTIGGKKNVDAFGEAGGEGWEEQIGGRLCYPGMLLHPVKDVKKPGN